MQIIIGRDVAEKLMPLYIVLELEEIDKDGIKVEAFVVVSAEQIGIDELATLDNDKEAHNEYLKLLKLGNLEACEQLSGYLTGKFGGELDSFYEFTINRLKNQI